MRIFIYLTPKNMVKVENVGAKPQTKKVNIAFKGFAPFKNICSYRSQ